MKTIKRIVIVLLIAGFILTAIPATSSARQDEPVTHYVTTTWPIQSLDPQLANDSFSIGLVENLFLGLVDMHPESNTPVPELATSWEISEDRLVWTFTLRNDVFWVHWNSVAGEGEKIRPVTADDVAYGIQRACDPRLDVYYRNMVAEIVAGCDQVARLDPSTVTDADYTAVQVHALDDVTLEITLTHPAGYFLTMVTMPVFRPVLREVVETYGAEWTDPDHIVTNGAFVLSEWTPRVRHILLRSPYLPGDMQGSGNIGRVIRVISEESTQGLYDANQIDSTTVPFRNRAMVIQDPSYEGQVYQFFDSVVVYYGFAFDKAPLDDIHVRRAFAAMLDRQRFADEILPLVGEPIRHFTPPGTFGAPPLREVGQGFDPEYAREQLALAGYPNCEGLPPIQYMGTPTTSGMANFLGISFEEVLGCDPVLLTIDLMDFPVLMQTIDPALSTDERPHMWATGWGPDYPDANNWVGDVLSCDADNAFKRPCSEIDDLIFQAAIESDIVTRANLYRDIEERFFGPEGEFPIIPFFMLSSYALIKPWYSGPFATDGLFGGVHYDWYTIDQEAQLAARGG